jgi:hypothetical protein
MLQTIPGGVISLKLHYDSYRDSLSGEKRSDRGAYHPLASSTKVEARGMKFTTPSHHNLA